MRPVCVNVYMSTCVCSACVGACSACVGACSACVGACLASMCVCMHVSTQHRMTHNTRKLLILLAKLIDSIQCQLWRYRYVRTYTPLLVVVMRSPPPQQGQRCRNTCLMFHTVKEDIGKCFTCIPCDMQTQSILFINAS